MDYSYFLSHHLSSLTPDEHLTALADALAAVGAPEDVIARQPWSELVGNLLDRLLMRPEGIDAPRLYRWLGMGVTQRGHQTLRGEHRKRVQDLISTTPKLYNDLFKHWTEQTPADRLWLDLWRFRDRLCQTAPPSDFGTWLLRKVEAHDAAGTAVPLFELVCSYMYSADPPRPCDIEFLFGFTERHPGFAEILKRWSVCPVADWRIEGAQRRAARKAKQRARRVQNIQRLRNGIDRIRRGEGISALDHFAGVWFGHGYWFDRNAGPFDRLVSETNEEIAGALRDGFVALLHRRDLLPTPAEIAELCLQGQQPTIGEAVLAGLDIASPHGLAGRVPDAS